jgi:hypothetical protein
MGLPISNEKGYREGSPITHAHRLKGNLLLIYGTGDDNCHFQNCTELVRNISFFIFHFSFFIFHFSFFIFHFSFFIFHFSFFIFHFSFFV